MKMDKKLSASGGFCPWGLPAWSTPLGNPGTTQWHLTMHWTNGLSD